MDFHLSSPVVLIGALVVGASIGLPILLLVVLLLPSEYKEQSAPRSAVLVLGDIGRSPRMQYHALSIAKHGGSVDLIGYNESPLHPDLAQNPKVIVHALPPPPAILRSKAVPFIIAGPLKVLWQICSLYYVLAHGTDPAKWLLVQNPPSIPTLIVAGLVSFQRRTRLIIDWHNYGWTILAGTKGAGHPFVKISKIYECWMARVAPHTNITVTHAMAKQLLKEPYSITTPVFALHDRPAAIFQPLASVPDRRGFLERLPETRDVAQNILAGETRLIVSSTSWTPDEDFSLLLDALVEYAKDAPRPVVAIITGKGPQKAHYQAEIASLQKAGELPNIRILTAWLSMEDYAMLLSCADLGICLHMSSSGVDLPMKVVDMFGSGLPVAAYSKYESFTELVKEGQNGCGFETAPELAAILARLFSDSGANELRTLRGGAQKEGSLRWDEEWDRTLGRVLGFVKSIRDL
ncbi:mannosyltransferase [Pestalotiopsis sp. 9143b]|nr:mannosyltransferase [Pestalotiopsis sp. 9143b]